MGTRALTHANLCAGGSRLASVSSPVLLLLAAACLVGFGQQSADPTSPDTTVTAR